MYITTCLTKKWDPSVIARGKYLTKKVEDATNLVNLGNVVYSKEEQEMIGVLRGGEVSEYKFEKNKECICSALAKYIIRIILSEKPEELRSGFFKGSISYVKQRNEDRDFEEVISWCVEDEFGDEYYLKDLFVNFNICNPKIAKKVTKGIIKTLTNFLGEPLAEGMPTFEKDEEFLLYGFIV